MPWDGKSAMLSTDGTYKEGIHNLWYDKSKVILCSTWFCSGLLDLPPLIAWMTPWLSDLMRKWVSENPWWIANSRPNSIATISAYPMSWPSLSQTHHSFQASHSWPKTMPIPQGDDASTQNLTDNMGGGFKMGEPQKLAVSRVHHQFTSDKTLGLGILQTKADRAKLNKITNLEIVGRWDKWWDPMIPTPRNQLSINSFHQMGLDQSLFQHLPHLSSVHHTYHPRPHYTSVTHCNSEVRYWSKVFTVPNSMIILRLVNHSTPRKSHLA